MTLQGLTKWVQVLNHQLRNGSMVQNIIEQNEPFIVDCVANKQLFDRGVNALGVSIMDYRPYTPLTVQLKSEKNQPTDRVTLKDTGDFHKSIKVDADRTYFEIYATDWKTDDLKEKYGDEIFGLTPENKAELIWDKLYPAMLAQTKGLIFGGVDDLP